MAAPAPVLPDYGGACITNLLAAIRDQPAWLPSSVAGAGQVVLLVLDGLGWEQLQERRHLAPVLAGLEGGPITSVAPTTTAVALTSITTGLPPAGHEVVGYRVRVGDGDVLNVLRWRTGDGDARETVLPGQFQTHAVFGGASPPVVTKAEFAASGFTEAHLGGTRLYGWRTPSSVPVEVGRLLRAGEPFVYAYYDGIDGVAHARGFGEYYDSEVRYADRLVGDVLAALPPDACLLVTADHGQVQVGDANLAIPPALLAEVTMVSGEGRFRWLHGENLKPAAEEAFGDVAWVLTVDELDDASWFGGRLFAAGRSRLGDVAVIPHQPVAVVDPRDTGELSLRCRHGSLTSAEVLVPLLAGRA